MELKVVYGTLILNDDSLTIKRKGLGALSLSLRGDKTIPYSSIVAVQLKPATLLTSGFLQLTLKGGNEAHKGLLNAIHDENTVVFKSKKNNNLFNEAKELIEKKIINSSKPTSASNFDNLEQLASLKEKGIITEEEFNAKKKQILGL